MIDCLQRKPVINSISFHILWVRYQFSKTFSCPARKYIFRTLIQQFVVWTLFSVCPLCFHEYDKMKQREPWSIYWVETGTEEVLTKFIKKPWPQNTTINQSTSQQLLLWTSCINKILKHFNQISKLLRP